MIRRRIPSVLLAALAGFVAVACGDDEQGSSAADGGASGGSGTAAGGNGGSSNGGRPTGAGGRAAGGDGSGGASSPGGASSGGNGSGGGGAGTGGAAGNGGSPSSPDASAPAAGCAPLPVTGRVVELTPASNLPDAVRNAAAGDTLSLADGRYTVGGQILQLHTERVTLRSQSGNREAVIIDGEQAQNGEIVSVTANDVTIADVTIANAYAHAIHVQSTDAGDVLRTTIYNVHVLDALEQGIKINLNAAENHFPDDGTIACSHIELTASGRPNVRNNCYTGGIDAHGARGWRIRDNLIEGFFCATGLSEHGVHFWTGSRDTIVERNRIMNCARGVGFGLGEDTGSSTDDWRTYPDAPCGTASPVGHYGGIVRNNFIFADDAALFASQFGFDTGVGLEQACEATVVHNTIFGTTPPLSSAVEWRFANTSATVQNNLANATFKDRGAGATATASGNLDTATGGTFVDAASGDLHLAPSATAPRGAGVALSAGVCDDDIDSESRTDPRDVGADQL